MLNLEMSGTVSTTGGSGHAQQVWRRGPDQPLEAVRDAVAETVNTPVDLFTRMDAHLEAGHDLVQAFGKNPWQAAQRVGNGLVSGERKAYEEHGVPGLGVATYKDLVTLGKDGWVGLGKDAAISATAGSGSERPLSQGDRYRTGLVEYAERHPTNAMRMAAEGLQGQGLQAMRNLRKAWDMAQGH